MTATIIVGAQFGSEGKGKVAHWWAKNRGAKYAVRVGGPNAGHTVVADGQKHIFRQIPTPAVLPDLICLIAAGSYIDLDVLFAEIEAAGLSPERLRIDPNAHIVSSDDKTKEQEWGLRKEIGSTLSGTGAAVSARVQRISSARLAKDVPELEPYVDDVRSILRDASNAGARVIVEGTQGFGLSVLHSPYFPYATSRDTTAAGFVAEAGMSPFDVDEVVLVMRAFPIRVAGNSGPLPNEIDWDKVTRESSSTTRIVERTSVTKQVRRVARFDPEIVRQAIQVNAPSHLVMNHVDYVDAICRESGELSAKAREFVSNIEEQIALPINLIGLLPSTLLER